MHRLLMDSLTNEQQQQASKASPPHCSLDMGALQAQAAHCNSKKLAAKNAQEASDRCVRSCIHQYLPVCISSI